MDFIYRISGREARDLNDQIVKLQNRLNSTITELDASNDYNVKLQKRILHVQEALLDKENALDKANQEIKTLKIKIGLETKIKEEALASVDNAKIAITNAEQKLFEINQEIASKNADINEMVDKVSRLEQQLKDINEVKNIPTKLDNIKRRFRK